MGYTRRLAMTNLILRSKDSKEKGRTTVIQVLLFDPDPFLVGMLEYGY